MLRSDYVLLTVGCCSGTRDFNYLNCDRWRHGFASISAKFLHVVSPHFCSKWSGAPNDKFRKISVGKTIWDLEFSKHLLQNFFAWLPSSPRIFEHLKNGIIAHFWRIFTLKRSPRIFGSPFSGWNFRKGKFWSL